MRLIAAVDSSEYRTRVGIIFDHYAWFLRFMESDDNRKKLAGISHGTRFDLVDDNPFPHLKLNSDLMHHAMVKLINELPATIRDKVFRSGPGSLNSKPRLLSGGWAG